MKNVTIVGILAAASLLTGCRSRDSNRSAIDIVRNGYLKYNRTTTIGQALAGTFQNGEWKSFTTKKGATIVEFDGSEPFGENFAFAPTVKMIDDYCKSDAGKTAYSKEQTSYETMKAQVAQLKQQESDLSSQANKTEDSDERLSIETKESDVRDEEIQLSNKLYGSPDGQATCLETTTKQHANDPIPVVVQFSINLDGTTFQYEANDMGLSVEALFEKIYK
jgi:hypothetical protein